MIKTIEIERVMEMLDQINFSCIDLMKLNNANEQIVLGDESFALIIDGGRLLEREISKVKSIEVKKVFKSERNNEISKLELKIALMNESYDIVFAACDNKVCKVSLEKLKDIVNHMRLANDRLVINEVNQLAS